MRAGIHVGRVKPKEDDVYGQTVNYAARVQSALHDDGVIISDDLKREIERLLGRQQKFIQWELLENQELRGFDGRHNLWRIKTVSRRFLTMHFN